MSQAHRASLGLLCLTAAAGGVAAFAACGGGGSSATGSTGTTGTCANSVALPPVSPGDPTDAGVLAGGDPVYATAFDGYTSWQTYHFTTSVDAGPHEAGNLTAWINKVPPPGSTEFPVGTIIVKRIESIPQTFAMEKRADDFNSDGAVHWEYFELENQCDGKTPFFVWRGFGPPQGEAYGGNPAACNDCHVGFKDNDYVGSSVLQLGNF